MEIKNKAIKRNFDETGNEINHIIENCLTDNGDKNNLFCP